ncbi:MAG TPA: YdcF family protein, partial [Cyclobacteriaceae bacterium]|nr:YdcF family protein [Cyclobacteriaceae bacterium]
MFFVLSKVLNFLTNPLIYVLAFFLLSIFLKRPAWKKRCFWIAFSLLIFFSNDFIANETMRAWEVPAIPYSEIKKQYDWGIVLTGVTYNDKQPDDRVYFQHGADRVVHTVELYKLGIIKKIMISGGSGRLVTNARKEADELFKVMKLMGVPEQAMAIENESRNTYESAVKVKELLKDEPAAQYLLITSAFHLRRSKACFKKAGFEVDTFSTDFYTHPFYLTPDVLLIPSANAIFTWQKLFKEWTGMIAYKIAGYI